MAEKIENYLISIGILLFGCLFYTTGYLSYFGIQETPSVSEAIAFYFRLLLTFIIHKKIFIPVSIGVVAGIAPFIASYFVNANNTRKCYFIGISILFTVFILFLAFGDNETKGNALVFLLLVAPLTVNIAAHKKELSSINEFVLVSMTIFILSIPLYYAGYSVAKSNIKLPVIRRSYSDKGYRLLVWSGGKSKFILNCSNDPSIEEWIGGESDVKKRSIISAGNSVNYAAVCKRNNS